MNRERILTVLYDLALTIGSEATLPRLLTRTLQRLLYHTSFPAGFVILGATGDRSAPRVEATVGDFQLAEYLGTSPVLTSSVLGGRAGIIDAALVLNALPKVTGEYQVCLRLPVPGNGVVFLLAPSLPATSLPLDQVFQPVLTNLAQAILLCRNNDAYHDSLRADRDSARQALQEREEIYRSIVEQALDSIALIDAETAEVVEFNETAHRNLGYSRDEFARLRLSDIVAVPKEKLLAEQAAIRTEGSRVFDSVHRTRDGRLRQVRVSARLIHIQGRTYFSSMWVDVTEARNAENALRESEARFHSLFANMHEGVLLCMLVRDDAGTPVEFRLVDCNRSAETMLGLQRGVVQGRLSTQVFGRSRPPFLSKFAAVADSGIPCEIETYYAETDRHISLSIVPWQDDGFAAVLEDITEHKRIQEDLERAANYDALTQLPNRALLSDRLHQAIAQARRSGRSLAVCYLDLDGFKPVNDTYGHEAGDKLLIDVSQRLQESLRGGDTVARLGGDEFVLLLGDLGNVAECELALERLLKSISRPYQLDRLTIDSVSASIGATLFPSDESDPDTLLRHADQAMYLAKQRGKDRYHVFDTVEDRELRSHQEALSRIQQGLAAGEFELFYQPKVDMRQGSVIGAEALIRWRHPQRGLLSPGEFLPAVEASDFAVRLGEWVTHESLRQTAEWWAQGLELTISINISPRHFQQHNFVERLAEILARHPDAPPGSLQLEVVETAALADLNHVSTVMRECQKFGISFALDDFGTGYSSLTYLKRLPAGVLKIDQSFIRDMLRDPEDLAIVDGVIGLADAFHRELVAEGVETRQHGVLLLQLGCDIAQGYGIARPMPAADLPAWVASYQQDPLWEASKDSRWPREDLPLLSAALEHRHWIDRVKTVLLESPQRGTELIPLDVHDCNFGRWYDGAGSDRYGHLPEFAAIAPLHSEVHQLARELLALHESGEGTRAAERLDELRELRTQLLGLIDTLRGRVTGAPRHPVVH